MDILKLTDEEVQIMADTAWSAWSMAQAVAQLYPDRKRSAKKVIDQSLEEAHWLDAELRRRGILNVA